MNRTLPAIFFFAILISLYSCSTRVYTHQQVMQSFQTKKDVTKRFGVPSEKLQIDSTESWTYSFDTPSTLPQSIHPDSIKGPAPDHHTDSLRAVLFPHHTKYIKFLFDTAGNVTGYKSNGVNLGMTKKDSFGIGLLKVLGVTAFLVVVIGVEIANNTYNSN
jgi:hypothetical protein